MTPLARSSEEFAIGERLHRTPLKYDHHFMNAQGPHECESTLDHQARTARMLHGFLARGPVRSTPSSLHLAGTATQQRVQVGLSFRGMRLSLTIGGASDAASYHLEMHALPGMLISALSLPSGSGKSPSCCSAPPAWSGICTIRTPTSSGGVEQSLPRCRSPFNAGHGLCRKRETQLGDEIATVTERWTPR